MKWIGFFSALLMLLLVASPALADNSISASASDAGSGVIHVSGTVSLACGSSLYPASVTVNVWQEGYLITDFVIGVGADNTFDGNTGLTTFATGTYSVDVQVIIKTGTSTDPYVYLIRGLAVK